ncbi:site-specific integrase [Trichocoleus desertorum AS-A10]|uniref:site-specific integrase n=1 Tax=Trichocoleus desertorum TaxID=1481672 RepID=UPI00329A72E6
MASCDIDALIAKANERLKAAAVRVRVYRKGAKLYLQGTLPPKPNSNKLKPHQQYLTLGVSANLPGLKVAEARAKEVDALLSLRQFNWAAWIKQSAIALDQLTVAEWLERFEASYFQSRPRGQSQINTFHKNYWLLIRRMPQDEILTASLLLNTIEEESEAGSRNRQLFCMSYGALAKLAGIEIDLKVLDSSYSPKSVSPRDLPTDEEIVAAWERIKNPGWKWIFAMLATYGLRNHEVFRLDTSRLREPPHTLRVLQETKTGSRLVYPCPSCWAEKFEVWNVCYPKTMVEDISNNRLGQKVYCYFRAQNLGLTPYDLRHSYAGRTAILGVADSLASRWMGHSVAVHTKIYHQFLDESHNKKAWDIMREQEKHLYPD